MEITAEQQSEIEAIKRELKCPKDFKCYKQGFVGFPRLRRAGELLECLEDNPLDCAFSTHFGGKYYCWCPLMHYIHGLGT
jgi:hypothetical protein